MTVEIYSIMIGVETIERGDRMIDYNFKITLRAARVNKGLTQEKAAKLLCISPSTLNKWEKRPYLIPAYRQLSISDLYGIPADRIIFLPNQ